MTEASVPEAVRKLQERLARLSQGSDFVDPLDHRRSSTGGTPTPAGPVNQVRNDWVLMAARPAMDELGGVTAAALLLTGTKCCYMILIEIPACRAAPYGLLMLLKSPLIESYKGAEVCAFFFWVPLHYYMQDQ